MAQLLDLPPPRWILEARQAQAITPQEATQMAFFNMMLQREPEGLECPEPLWRMMERVKFSRMEVTSRVM